MPSGAKKRKAAKKKKEKEANSNSATHNSLGDEDQKISEEKESDGGDPSSPESQGHHKHEYPFTEGEEEELEKGEDISYVRSIVPENEPEVGSNSNGESKQKVEVEESNIIQIDWEFDPENYSDSENVSTEHTESVKESHGGQMSEDGGSSRSSSDDESRVIEKSIVVVESGESKEDSIYSVVEAVFSDSVKTTDSPEVTQVTDGVPVMDAYNLAVGEPKEEESYDPVAANPLSVSLVKPADLPEIMQVTNGVRVNDSEPMENTSVIESGLNENEKNKGSGVSPVVMNMGSQSEEDKVSSTADGNSAVSSIAAGFAAQEDEYKLMPSPIVPSVNTINGAEHTKDSIVTECSDREPLVASSSRPVQTPFWKSCCGLFEVFTGSNS